MSRRLGAKLAGVVLAVISGFAVAAHAACTGPAALEARLKAHPTTDNAVLLGSWFASHKQFDCAVATFRTGLKSDPKSAQLHYLIALADVDGNRPNDAMPDLQKAVELDPGVIKPHLLLAFLYDQTGQHPEAEGQFLKALAIDPRSEQALEGLSQDLLNRKAYIETVLLLRSAPRTEKLAINLAKALGNMNMLDEAREALSEALKEHPKSLELSSAIIVVLVKQVRFQDAIDVAQHMVDLNPGNQDAQVQLLRILVLTNHINAARPIAPKLLAERPSDPEVLYLNGIVLRSVGDNENARKMLEKSVALDPNSPNSHYELGMVLVLLRDWVPAREQLEKSIDMGEKAPQVHYQLALALRGMGNIADAQKEIKIFETWKKNDEVKLEAAMKAAQSDDEIKMDRLPKAIEHLKEAVESQPDDANYRYKLALALHQSGDTDGEREQLEQAIKLNPSLAGAQNELGYLVSRAGDSNAAIDHFRLAVQSAPGYVEAWINLAAELAMAGKFSDARNAVDMALRLDPDNQTAHKLSDRLAQDPGAQQSQP